MSSFTTIRYSVELIVRLYYELLYVSVLKQSGNPDAFYTLSCGFLTSLEVIFSVASIVVLNHFLSFVSY